MLKSHPNEINLIKEALSEFDKVDAYRYNSASIRVRVVDKRFETLSRGERVDMVEVYLSKLPEDIQKDIIVLKTLSKI